MALVILVGLPGVGKSTVGALVADELHCPFVDLDAVITAREGRTPAEILREDGETVFRDHELDALRFALASDGVLATGGGVVTIAEARALLKASGHVAYLVAPVDALVTRVTNGDRPLLGPDAAGALANLAASRVALYEDVADVTVDANRDVVNVVTDVVAAVRKWSHEVSG